MGTYLVHHGILGMKWGVRRYQNPDGSLTAAGKARVAKTYRKKYGSYAEAEAKNANRRFVRAYNKTATEWNNGKTEAYNEKHSPDEEDYYDNYNKLWDADFEKNYAKIRFEELTNTPKYNEAHEYAKKYGLYSYDKLAQKNQEYYDIVKKTAGGR